MADYEQLMAQYDGERRTCDELCTRLLSLVTQLLVERRISVHSITGRVKDRSSYQRKITSKEPGYQNIEDITDVVGIRVITYFANQVDEVAKIIENEFMIDRENSIDKRLTLDPDRFGYLSLHYVVSLSKARSALTEYKAFRGRKAEIQIRSILQHAWAEIEHDLGYKTSHEVPRDIRRQFSRLAGLLELADSEFVNIRTALDNYKQGVRLRIATEPQEVRIDRVSLIDFVKTDPIVAKLDRFIAESMGYGLRTDDDAVAREVQMLKYFGIETILQLKEQLQIHEGHISSLRERWPFGGIKKEQQPKETVAHGISLFYFCYVLAAVSRDTEQVQNYLETFHIGTQRWKDAKHLVDLSKDWQN